MATREALMAERDALLAERDALVVFRVQTMQELHEAEMAELAASLAFLTDPTPTNAKIRDAALINYYTVQEQVRDIEADLDVYDQEMLSELINREAQSAHNF